MKHSIVRAGALLFAIACILSGCAGSGGNAVTPAPSSAPGGTEDAAVTPALSGSATVAAVNGAFISRNEFILAFFEYYQANGISAFSSLEELYEFQAFILSDLVQREVIYDQALKRSISLTAEEELAVQEATRQEYDALLYNVFAVMAAQEGAEDIGARAVELLEESLQSAALTTDTLRDYMEDKNRKTAYATKLRALVVQDVPPVSEEEARETFALDRALDREKYEKDPTAFESDVYGYELSGARPPLYIPEGYIRVQNLLVEDDEALAAVERLIDEGVDFAELIRDYGTDPGMQLETMRINGYALCPSSAYIEAFKKAAFALENVGDISAPVRTEHGYHIIRLVAKLEQRTITFDDVRDDYIAGKYAEKQTTYFYEQLAAWVEAADISEHLNLVRDVGQ